MPAQRALSPAMILAFIQKSQPAKSSPLASTLQAHKTKTLSTDDVDATPPLDKQVKTGYRPYDSTRKQQLEPPKEVFGGYVNNAPDEAPAVPSVTDTEATPDLMVVQTSVSPLLNMDDLQVVFTTSNDPHKWITFPRATWNEVLPF